MLHTIIADASFAVAIADVLFLVFFAGWDIGRTGERKRNAQRELERAERRLEAMKQGDNGVTI